MAARILGVTKAAGVVTLRVHLDERRLTQAGAPLVAFTREYQFPAFDATSTDTRQRYRERILGEVRAAVAADVENLFTPDDLVGMAI